MAKWTYQEDIKENREVDSNKVNKSKVTDKYCQTPETAGVSTAENIEMANEASNTGDTDGDDPQIELRRSKRGRNTTA